MKYFVEALDSFNDWLGSLRDIRAKVAIVRRIDRAGLGNFGDHKAVGEGVSEMRIDIGQGYRVYYTIRQQRIVFLLCGGNKVTQSDDIKRAIKLAREV
ncbi:type II toxin-antitoxin system RelE/ParE family toxin [Oxalobacter aliiformigenes]|uniref:type II toxin-antitoxin system RelE/ParE family toxin n=1 Tax=Oxalobacter aliiformigenes TaxID=2946593 RepID=UPI0022AEFCCB|nr:type II toxin-antitoxin system RelE/ParE family toxin [Oxalobacter aliiformigenes]MCZ4065482.1 type II toxin-antitoxin system RelE/ParE family toxin [Oxalobacter aliiformigenes]WAV99642.1 type II toxin-antitoxin system RelE/ParE family toxin [Oxalobacter aliiformigenes]